VVDAHATSIVYSAPVNIHRSVGLDVTSQVSMTPEVFRGTFKDIPLFAPILEWAEIWFKDRNGTTYHDPLAAATIFEPSLCSYRRGRVSISLVEGVSFGLTRWSAETAGAPHEIAVGVDSTRFFEHYLSVVRGS
jgi:inosine-uridine nucleoside N-ribohydrolase